jgi:predicted GH43/DUF377 family glycosyl hydrolase
MLLTNTFDEVYKNTNRLESEVFEMEGGSLRTVILTLIIISLTLFAIFSPSTGDTWLQSTQVDFDAGEKTNVDTFSDPGNVTLSSVWTKLPTDCALDVGSSGSWDDFQVYKPSVLYDGMTYHMWYTGNDGSGGRIGYATSSNGITWTKHISNPVFDVGSAGAWDDGQVFDPHVIYDGTTYHMWYGGDDGSVTNNKIGYANSTDGIVWTRHPSNPVLSQGPSGSWDDYLIHTPCVVYNGSTYHMWYTGHDGSNRRIGYATSYDGITWSKNASNPVLDLGTPGSWDDNHVQTPVTLFDGTTYRMWYVGHDGANWRTGYATSYDGIMWNKYAGNPVLDLGVTGAFDEYCAAGSSILYNNVSFTYQMWYTSYDGTWRIGYVNSTDGVTWTKIPSIPVLDIGAPTSWDDISARFPSVVHDGVTYHMWYSGQDGSNSRIGHATSPNGYQWTKDAANPVLDLGPPTSWDDFGVYYADVIYNGTGFQMWYTADDGVVMKIGYATSPDGSTWTKHPGNPVLDLGVSGSFDDVNVYKPAVFYDGSIYHMWYSGSDGAVTKIGYATSPDGVIWTKYPGNPVLELGPSGSWEDEQVRAPDVYFDGSNFHMWYTGVKVDSNKIGYAISSDGINWIKNPANPVLDVGLPGTWDDYRVNTPSVIFDGSLYRMWFSGHDGSYPRIGYAELCYNHNGALTSSVFDSGAIGTVWNSIVWTEYLPSNTNISIATRSGDVPIPDGSWSSWSTEMFDETGSTISSPPGRYIQYRTTFRTNDRFVTPILSEVQIDYSRSTSQVPTLSFPSNNAVTSDATPTFEWIFNDPEGDSQEEFEVQIDDDPMFSSIDYSSGDTDGVWFWRVKTMDEHGNWSDWSESWTITIDTTPPEPFTPTANPDSWTNNSQPEITFSTTDSLSGMDHYEVRIDSGSFTIQTSPSILITQTDGIHNITVRAFDSAGNYRDGYVEVFIDTTPPEPFAPTANPDSWTNNTQPEITFSTTDTLSGVHHYEVQINGGSFTIQTSPYILPSQSDGIHNITVRAFDMVGNYREDYVDFFIDTTPPAAPLNMISSPSSWTIANLFSIDWINPTDVSGIKNGAWYKFGDPPTSDSDGNWLASKPISITSLEGEHTIYLWLEDNVGNKNHLNYSTVNLLLDSIAPNIIHSAVTKAEPGKEITITATVTDNVAVKVVKLHYRKQGDEAFEIINMSKEGDVYTAKIPSSFVTTKGIEYYISASDEINTATYPSSDALADPLPIDIEDDPEPWFMSLCWLFLLLAIILIILFLLLAIRRDEEDVGNGAIPQEETVFGQTEDSTTTMEEPVTSETGEHQKRAHESVPPTPSQDIADNEIFEKVKQLYEKDEISEETFEDFKRRYKKE